MRDRKMNLEEIAKIVEDTLASKFTKLKIMDVKVEEGFDSDEQEMLRIYVFFQGQPKDLESGIVSGAVRIVRPELSKRGITEFPLFSFIANSDVGPAKLARA